MDESSTETASSGSEVYDRNRRLRTTYRELEQLAVAADKAGDLATAARLRERMRSIGNRFVELNQNLVAAPARRFRTSDSASHWQDFDQGALEGLWEAFLKWDPEAKHRNRTTGEYTRVTFATFSRPYIDGRLKRTVFRVERPELKYHTASDGAHVRAAEQQLAEHADGPISNEEVAAAASQRTGRTITVETVAQVRRGRAVSLDAPAGGDADGQTLGARLAATSTGMLDLLDDDLLTELVAELDGRQLFLLLATTALHGRAPLTIKEAAALTGIGRETVRVARNAALAAFADAAGAKTPAALVAALGLDPADVELDEPAAAPDTAASPATLL